jgi:hypothetical protein
MGQVKGTICLCVVTTTNDLSPSSGVMQFSNLCLIVEICRLNDLESRDERLHDVPVGLLVRGEDLVIGRDL